MDYETAKSIVIDYNDLKKWFFDLGNQWNDALLKAGLRSFLGFPLEPGPLDLEEFAFNDEVIKMSYEYDELGDREEGTICLPCCIAFSDDPESSMKQAIPMVIADEAKRKMLEGEKKRREKAERKKVEAEGWERHDRNEYKRLKAKYESKPNKDG